MFREIGNAIRYVVTSPMRFYRWCVECIVAVRRFLNIRRNQLCASIIAIMMAVVGVQLRHGGYADARPGEYAAVSFEELEEPSDKQPEKKRTRATLRQAMKNSLIVLKSKLPTFSTGDEPQAEAVETTGAPATPVVTVSQQRTTLEIPALPTSKPPGKRTLILPEPTIIDLTDIEDPKPDVASLSGLIETDDEDGNGDSFFDRE